MNLGTLRYAPGSRRKRKRVGRGEGSGHGGTACKGHKGQRSRSGSRKPPWFEGGQTPLHRRLPHKGFTNIFKKEYQIVNVGDLERKVESGTEVTPELLYNIRLIRKRKVPVKVLGDGELTKALTVSAHAFSQKAVEKIEAAGGQVIRL